MITIDDKLELFRKIVLNSAQNDYDIQLEMIDAAQEDQIKAFTEEVKAKGQAFVNQMIHKSEQEEKRMISRARSEAKHQVLAKRQELINHLIEAVTDRIQNFVASEIYGDFLKDSVKETLDVISGFDAIELEMTREDYRRFSELLDEELHNCGYKSRQIKLIPTDKDIIGGFVAYNGSRAIKVDCSLAGLIRDNQSFMGRLVFEILNEAGEQHG